MTDDDARWYLSNVGRFLSGGITPDEEERVMGWMAAKREQEYLQRPRPRLGAGTVGYARRRRP